MKLIRKVIISMILVASIVCIQKQTLATTGIVDADTLNLRKSPSTDSSVLKLLNKDEKVEILEQDGVWYKVKINGTIGYVHSDYIEKVEEEPTTNIEPENNVDVKDNPQQNEPENNVANTEIPKEIKIEKQVDIYILPLINSSKISKTEVGETVTVLGNTDKWLYVSAKNVNGWIIKGQVIEETISNENNNNEGNATENTNTQNNENSNTENSNSETSNSDNQTTIENKETALTPKTMYVNSPSIYVRKGPGTNYPYIDSLILNSGVTVIAEVGDWYKVKVSGLEGYIAKRLLSNTKQDTTSRGDVVREEIAQESQNQEQQEQQTQTTTSTNSVGNQIVEYAKQYLGCKYVYGGSGPKTFDCSGFTMYVYKKFGVSLSHSARAQSKKGTYVAKEDLQPGDIVFFKDYETMDGIGHCGIYIGNGDFIHASSGTGYCVKISTLLSGSYKTRYETARRLI